MNFPTPHYINELQSDMRGIKEGWYAIEHDGNLAFGPEQGKGGQFLITRFWQTIIDFLTQKPRKQDTLRGRAV